MTKTTFVLALLPTNGIIIYIFVPQFSQEISTLLQKILLWGNFTPFIIYFFEAFNETKHHFVLCRLNCETCIQHQEPACSVKLKIICPMIYIHVHLCCILVNIQMDNKNKKKKTKKTQYFCEGPRKAACDFYSLSPTISALFHWKIDRKKRIKRPMSMVMFLKNSLRWLICPFQLNKYPGKMKFLWLYKKPSTCPHSIYISMSMSFFVSLLFLQYKNFHFFTAVQFHLS